MQTLVLNNLDQFVVNFLRNQFPISIWLETEAGHVHHSHIDDRIYVDGFEILLKEEI